MMASRLLSHFLPNTESLNIDPNDGFLEDPDDAPHSNVSNNEHELNALLAEAERDDSPVETGPRRAGWTTRTGIPHADLEDDVPHSIMMEEDNGVRPQTLTSRATEQPPASRTEDQWKRAQAGQPLHVDQDVQNVERQRSRHTVNKHAIDAKEQALWRWTNVQNLDAFLLELYEYYADHGIWSIVLSRIIVLLYVYPPDCLLLYL